MVEKEKSNVPQENQLSLGLSEFFLKMADPNPEDLRKFITQIAEKKDLKVIENLQWNLENARNKSLEEKLEKGGFSSDQSKQIIKGVVNAERLVGEMISDMKFGEGLETEHFINYAIEEAAAKKAEDSLGEKTDSLKAEPDLKRRASKARGLKKEILEFTDKFHVRLKEVYGNVTLDNPNWKALTDHNRWAATMDMEYVLKTADFLTRDAVIVQAAIERLTFEKKLKKIPQIDKEEFNQLRLQYGAKAANLILLSSRVNAINTQWDDMAFDKMDIPEFKPVGVDLYKKWKAKENIDEELKSYFDWASSLKDKNFYDETLRDSDIIVRSSAVFSEDGETLTGAGIYDSVGLYAGATFEDFKKAVIKVYKSAKSTKAIEYRKQNSVKKEEMGLVIQRFETGDTHYVRSAQASGKGYLNTSAHGVPQLMEVVTETSRNFISKKNLDYYLPLDSHFDEFREIFHYPPDKRTIHERSLVKTAQLAQVIEKIWGKSVQIEFVFGETKINIVQVRESLKQPKEQASTIEFPDLIPCHSGAAIGIGDIKLDVLTSYDEFDEQLDNSQERALVVLWANDEWSFRGNFQALPKEGAVVIAEHYGANGHIQTICAERGLVCLYPDNNPDTPKLSYSELKNLKRVRVVANGIEGRVYKIE